VRHPSEDSPINDGTPNSTLNRSIEMLDLNGNPYTQNRILPRGSNWPGTAANEPPQPSPALSDRRPPQASNILLVWDIGSRLGGGCFFVCPGFCVAHRACCHPEPTEDYQNGANENHFTFSRWTTGGLCSLNFAKDCTD
jgi:hypothetical protein